MAPPGEYCPELQLVHTLCPTAVLYFPPGQAMHVDDDALEYCPIEQLTHVAPPTEYCPAAHAVQVLAPAELELPSAQVEQLPAAAPL